MTIRKTLLTTALAVCIVASLLALLAERSLAKPIHQPTLAGTPPLHGVVDMMIKKADPVTHIRRLSAGALAEFDLNRDGRISDMERVRATALFREQRQAFSWYGELFSSLNNIPGVFLDALLPHAAVDEPALGD